MKILPSGIIALIADGRIILRIIQLIINLKNKTMFTKIKYFISQLISKIELAFEGYITKYVVPTINFLDEIKKAIDNPIVDFGATLAGIKLFPEVKAFLDKYIPEAVLALEIMHTDLTTKPDANGELTAPTLADYCNALITYLQSQSPAMQEATLAKIASLITKFANGKLTDSQATAITSAVYAKMKDEAATTA